MIAFALAVALAGPSAFQPLVKSSGGWKLEASVPADRAACEAAPLTGGRAALSCVVRSEDFTRSATSVALVGPDGTSKVFQPFAGRSPYAFSASPDGKIFAFASTLDADPNAPPMLQVFDASGKRLFERKIDEESDVIAGAGWVAIVEPPMLPETWEEDESEGTPPPLQAARPVVFYRPDGSRFETAEPITGNIARAGDGFAAVADGKVSVHRATLARRGRADLPFRVGMPFGSLGGATIAVGDVTARDDGATTQRSLLLFDAEANKLGEITLHAPLGAFAALSPDGGTVLAYSASPGVQNAVQGAPGFVEVVLASRDGKERFRKSFDSANEVLVSASVANGGSRVALVFTKLDESGETRVLLLDGKGETIRESATRANAAWLDASGLVIVEPNGARRLP